MEGCNYYHPCGLYVDVGFLCVFEVLTTLWKGACHCSRHERNCKVELCEGIAGGLSCKDLARSNPNRCLMKGSILSSATSPGRTADTFWGLIKLLHAEHCKASWILIENHIYSSRRKLLTGQRLSLRSRTAASGAGPFWCAPLSLACLRGAKDRI